MSRPRGSLAQRAGRAAGWSGLDGILRSLIGFAVTIVLARLVSPAEFGLIAIVLVFGTIANVLADGGLGTALIQRRAAGQVEESTAFYFNLGSASLLAVLLVLVAPWIADFFGHEDLVGLVWMMAANLVVAALGAIHATLLTKTLDFRPLVVAGLVSSLLAALLAIGLAQRGYGAWALAWQFLAQTAINTAILWWLHSWRPRGRFDGAAFRQMFAFGGHFLAARLIDTFYTRLYSVAIGKMFSAADLGFYGRAQSTQQLPSNLLASMLNRVALPAFSETATNSGRLPSILANASRLVMLFNLPAMLGLAMVAEPAITLLFGARWLPAAPLLQILCLVGALWPLQVLNVNALLAQGHSALLLRIELPKKAIGVVLLVLSVRYGLEAIAWSQVAATLIAFVINTHHNGRLLGFGALAQLRALWRMGLAALAMVATLAAFAPVWPVAAAPRLLAMVAAGSACYFAACWLLREPALLTARKALAATLSPASADR